MKSLILVGLMLSSLTAGASITVEMSQKIIQKVLACGDQKGFKLSVAIVNSESVLVAFQRGNGANVSSIDISQGKAKTANSFQRPTSEFASRVTPGTNNQLLSIEGLVAVAGGLPIKAGSEVIGGLGVSGASSAQDEECAIAGLAE